MFSKVTAKNVGDVFFETHCITYLMQLAAPSDADDWTTDQRLAVQRKQMMPATPFSQTTHN